MNKIREWISIKTVKSPRLMVLLGVLAANVVFIVVAAFVILQLSPPSLEGSGFWNSVLQTVIMYLDIGGIETVVEDVSQAGILLVLSSVIIILIGLVFFTYALIGYMSDLISSFIENADSSSRRLRISGHIVILNWNTRAAEIINDLLYKNTREKIIVLADSNKDDIQKDIDERLSDTFETEGGFKNKLTIVTRDGEPGSAKQLGDISIKTAKSVIILSDNTIRDTEQSDPGKMGKGNIHTIKILLQVLQRAESGAPSDNLHIIVEVEDDWTLALVNSIIAHKRRKGKYSIVPISVNKILGLIFSQFSIMPELNIVYSTLFSNRGAAFYTLPAEDPSLSDERFVSEYLAGNSKALPLTVMRGDGGKPYCYYMSDGEPDIHCSEPAPLNEGFKVSLNPDFELNDKYIVILGHNSKSASIIEGFNAFCGEWKKNDGTDVLDIIIIDNETSLEKQGYYKTFPFVKEVIAADIFEKELICNTIDEFIVSHDGNGCIMILSDDAVGGEDEDADALTYLILVQDIINNRIVEDPGFDPHSIDMVVEILNPKNYDIVNNYSVNNIVISNRYISKIIMQIGEKDSLFDFYYDILTYDDPEAGDSYSKELYIKKVDKFFAQIPEPCSAAELIRAVYDSSPDDNKSVVLGYFSEDGEMILFSGDQSGIPVTLTGEENLILFSNH